tara:strand:- start:2031 stop:2417 length:387 start_codon:yes stop_codon:yes gene_type:complete
MNSFSGLGRLGKDPELRMVGENKDRAVCNFSVALDDVKREGEKTTWLKVTVWAKQAESCQKNLRKGSQVSFVGKLKLREYEAKDGTVKVSPEVEAWDVRFVSNFGQVKNEPGKENGFAPEGDLDSVPF